MAKVRSNLKTRRRTYIREWRKYRQLTLEQLAERIDVTPSSLSQLERGLIGYTQPMLEALAENLRCDPPDLLMRDPTKSEAIWSIWDNLSPAERDQAVAVIKALKHTG